MAYRQEESIAEVIERSGVLAGRVPWYPARDTAPLSGQATIMTDTVVSSATREVVIGFDRPFVIIGERINPTGRKLLAAEMAAGDFSRVEADARAQVEAGAHMLDVNAGIPLADEPAILAKAIQLVQSITDVPLSIDSSIVAALEAGLAVYQGKALVNSVTGEDERLETVLPLVKKYGAAVVAISNDETGISEDPDVRFAVAKQHRAPRDGLRHPAQRRRRRPARDADRRHQSGRCPGDAAACGACASELKVNTTCGASNISFGLPNRDGINSAFLTMAIASGLTSAITNPLHVETVQACMAADVMMGHDPDCARWIRALPRSAAARRRRRGRQRGRRERGRRPRRVAGPAPERDPMTDKTPLVVFTPSGKRGRFPVGTPLLTGGAHARRRHRLRLRRPRDLRTLPGAGRRGRVRQARRALGQGQRCRPSPKSSCATRTARGAARWPPALLLDAGARATSSSTCRPSSQVHRQVVRKDAEARDIELYPLVSCTTSRCASPTCTIPPATCSACSKALEREWKLRDLGCDFAVLRELQPALRKGEWR